MVLNSFLSLWSAFYFFVTFKLTESILIPLIDCACQSLAVQVLTQPRSLVLKFTVLHRAGVEANFLNLQARAPNACIIVLMVQEGNHGSTAGEG